MCAPSPLLIQSTCLQINSSNSNLVHFSWIFFFFFPENLLSAWLALGPWGYCIESANFSLWELTIDWESPAHKQIIPSRWGKYYHRGWQRELWRYRAGGVETALLGWWGAGRETGRKDFWKGCCLSWGLKEELFLKWCQGASCSKSLLPGMSVVLPTSHVGIPPFSTLGWYPFF